MRRKKKFRPRRVDGDISFSAGSLDDRMPTVIRGRDVQNCFFDNIIGEGTIDIEGSGNLFRNVRIKNPRRKRV